MFKIIKESFDITNNNLNLATPLIIFSLISSLYLIFSASNNAIAMIFTIILFTLMLSAFFAGWFYMITQALKGYEDNKQSASFADFPAGVGEYFLPALCLLIHAIFIGIVLSILTFVIGKHFIGHLGVTSTQLINALSNVEAMKQFILSLTDEQILKLNIWNTLIFANSVIYYLFMLFYAPAMFFKKKNPYTALIVAIKDLFSRNFFKNVGLLTFIFTIYMIISVFSAIFGTNPIVHFILTLINFYYTTFAVVLVFNCYYTLYIKTGSVIDTKA